MTQEAQTVVRAFDILYSFSDDTPTRSVAEIARHVGLNRTTVYRLLYTLERCRAVQRHPESSRFSLHPHLLQFANVILGTSDLRTVAQAPMQALWDQTGETVALHLRDGLSRIVFTQIESRRFLRVTYPLVGEVIPLNIGAPSKAIVAFLTDEELDAFLDADQLIAATEASLTDQAALRAEVATIRERGYAVSFGERRQGVVSIAAPIYQSDGTVTASLNVVGPDERIQETNVPDLANLVVATARQISQQLGYRPTTPASTPASRDYRVT